MKRFSMINYLADLIKARSYLEIGVRRVSDNFNKINIQHKVGVDPGLEGYNEATYQLTSDDFFASNYEFFDIIFIDGLHEQEQVLRDIINSLSILNPKGFIVCHDMNPLSEASQMVPRIQKYWHGDCWKAWVKLRQTNPNISMNVIPDDCGLGIIQHGSQELLDIKGLEITYENFEKHREEWLNLISLKEFLNNIN